MFSARKAIASSFLSTRLILLSRRPSPAEIRASRSLFLGFWLLLSQLVDFHVEGRLAGALCELLCESKEIAEIGVDFGEFVEK